MFTEKPETQICLSIFTNVSKKLKKVFKEATFILMSQSRLSSTIPQFWYNQGIPEPFDTLSCMYCIRLY